jgi:arsenite methyltransferase
MAELSTNACCSTTEQTTCCEPADKAACCEQRATGGTCGCVAGAPAADGAELREIVRAKYAAAALATVDAR